MFELGTPEVLILLVLLVIVGLPVLLKWQKSRDRPQVATTHVPPPTTPRIPGPGDLPGVRSAIARRDWASAIDLYEQASGLPRRSAETAVMAAAEPGPRQRGADEPSDVGRTEPGDRDGGSGGSWPELPPRNQV